jgi:integrase
MLSARNRGKTYRVEGVCNKRYVRLALGTRDRSAAIRCVSQIELALVEGKNSPRWSELEKYLPAATFQFFANVTGWQRVVEAPAPTWAELYRDFSTRFERQVLQGERSSATWTRYRSTCESFAAFLLDRQISKLGDITRRVIEDFKVWKLAQIRSKKFARQGQGLRLDIAILHGVFAFAMDMEDLNVIKNPVLMEGTPGRKPGGGAEPFTADDLSLLRRHAGLDLLAFLLLRYTGLRGFDAVDLRWSEIDLKDRMLSRVTHKRGKPVWIPISAELLFALETEHARRSPVPDEHVLLNPETEAPMTRPGLYRRIQSLGRRASVAKAHPHRFRDTLAVDLLLKGATAYDVAKTLGDTVAVVEMYYAPYVKELRERTRRIMESPEGIERLAEPDCTIFAQQTPPKEHLQ